jgi:hypothetical protein
MYKTIKQTLIERWEMGIKEMQNRGMSRQQAIFDLIYDLEHNNKHQARIAKTHFKRDY